MVRSPTHWEQPASDKASAAAEEKQLRPGKSDLKAPRDSDWHFAGKQREPIFRQSGCGRVQATSRASLPAHQLRGRFGRGANRNPKPARQAAQAVSNGRAVA